MKTAGKWLTLVSVVLMALCMAPIMLYIAFGPEDGNPIGLGLLMVFGTPLFGVAAVAGAAMWITGALRAAQDL